MTCKIDRVLTPDGCVVLRISGRIDRVEVQALSELAEKEKTTKGLAIDLTEVTVVSLEVVEALTVAETHGIELRSCPPYIREWISQVRERGLPE
jgi:anti-anti-sigma regulatory factor